MNTTTPNDLLRRAVLQRLESLQRAGVTHLARPRRVPPIVDQPTVPEVSSPSESVTFDATLQELPPMTTPSSSDRPSRQAELNVIQQKVAACVRCAELAETRTQTVFGVGNPAARLVFLGEAPGADEDRQGIPFVGRAGQLLTKIIEACTLSRDDVYILNILKCRPPGNRNPLPQEAENCREYLDGQLAVIRPEFIVCLGAVAARNLLKTEASIGQMRGKFYRHNDIRVLCTYHPAYLLRNPAAKRDVWEDMQLLMREMGIPVKTSGKG
ncbi:MAG TPA: uracil-DNA glycosylase [Thermoguttaceae bacterium]|nr:uracil-DNA glycosylase [Thermoguttaceae bacterium]